MGMKLTKDTGGNGSGMAGEVPAAGLHMARVVAVIDLGTHLESFKSGPLKEKRKLFVVYELTDEKDSEGKTKRIARDYTMSGADRAGIRKLCEAVFGKEPEGGWDMEKMVGAGVGLNVSHTEGESATFADAGDVVGLLPDVRRNVPKPTFPPFYWDMDSPADYQDRDWVPYVFCRALRKRIKASEMIAASKERDGRHAPQQQAPQPVLPDGRTLRQALQQPAPPRQGQAAWAGGGTPSSPSDDDIPF
jgi:hypothetical protein